MAFRKRNKAVDRSLTDSATQILTKDSAQGVRPSSLTSHPVTSTGTQSLDSLLGGYGGLALGCSLLVEESGTTDFAGALLRYYVAEGICHGHIVHVAGVGDGWVRGLPGTAEETSSGRKEKTAVDEEKMKIAWRYEKLGQTGERGACPVCSIERLDIAILSYDEYFPFPSQTLMVSTALPDRSISTQGRTTLPEAPFCHTFDLTKRLVIPQDAKINHIQISPSSTPFEPIVRHLEQSLKASPPNIIHRLVIPAILSPALYPPHASRPENLVSFMHSLRALLRQHSTKLTAMITLPLELYPRSSGMVRWAEILSDGVVELIPFPHLMDTPNSLAESGGAGSREEQPQGMVKVHKLPINTERGEGGAGVGNSMGEDLAYTVSRRKFVIKPFSLPPLEGDQEAQKDAGKLTGKGVEF